jgi:hypothetical protein
VTCDKSVIFSRYWNIVESDYCFTIMSSDSLVYYLIFIWWLKPLALFNRTNIIYMTTSVSWRLNISHVYIVFNIIAFFIIKLFNRLLCVRVGILLACGKYLHDHTISLRGEVSAHKINLTPPVFMARQGERSCISVLFIYQLNKWFPMLIDELLHASAIFWLRHTDLQ